MLYALEMIRVKDNAVVDSRRMGVFTVNNLDELRQIITTNETDIWEFYYQYAVVAFFPENTLYSDCRERILEVYHVHIPEAMLEARRAYIDGEINSEAMHQVEKNWIDRVVFEQVTEYPDCINKMFTMFVEE